MVSTRSLVPKVADSNCGAENAPVFEIYFCSCFCTWLRPELAAKAGVLVVVRLAVSAHFQVDVVS